MHMCVHVYVFSSHATVFNFFFLWGENRSKVLTERAQQREQNHKKSCPRLLDRLPKTSGDMTHSCVWRDLLWRVHIWDFTTLLIYKNKLFLRSLDRLPKPSGGMTHSCVWRDLGACVILWLVHICDIATLLIHKNKLFSRSLDRLWKPSGGMTHSCVWLDLGACVLL